MVGLVALATSSAALDGITIGSLNWQPVIFAGTALILGALIVIGATLTMYSVITHLRLRRVGSTQTTWASLRVMRFRAVETQVSHVAGRSDEPT